MGFDPILPRSPRESHRKPTVWRLSKRRPLVMGQRMSAQKMLCFEQSDQGKPSGLMNKVLLSRSVLLEPSPPILLPLTANPYKPLAKRDLFEETQKNRKPDRLKSPIIEIGPQSMNCPTVRTTISLQQQRFWKPVKKPAYITMTPQPWASAPRTPRRTGPRILLSHSLHKLDIEIAIQYQVRSLWGVTEDTTPGGECNLGYPFSFPSTYSEKKKDLYNKR